MRYRWDDYSLDHACMLLTRQGIQVPVSRKVLDCIHHLVENRHRVVAYDEMILRIWGHHDISNHQLSQVVLAARRALGDDGHSQRLIRTAPGLGYRWVGVVTIETPAVHPVVAAASAGAEEPTPVATTDPMPTSPAAAALPAGSRPDTSPAPAIAPARPVTSRRKGLMWTAGVVCCCSGLAVVLHHGGTNIPLPDRSAAAQAKEEPAGASVLARLRARLDEGAYEDVRLGLATLPPLLAKDPDARLLEIELDSRRGRIESAMEKLQQEQKRAEAAQDIRWRIRILTLKSTIHQKRGADPRKAEAAAQSALDLLDTLGTTASATDISAALGARAGARLLEKRFDEAMRDYVRARDIALAAGNDLQATMFRSNLARAWMRVGRLREAHEELASMERDATRSGNTVERIFTLNTLSRLQVELLRWDEALATNDRALSLLRDTPGSDRLQRALALRAFILSAKGRLHEARAQLEEARYQQPVEDDLNPMIGVMHHLEAGAREDALERIEYIFRHGPYPHEFNPMLEDAEGPLLAWTMAAPDTIRQDNGTRGLPAEQIRRLQTPETATGHIARGRWLLLRGNPEAAEAEFRLAMQETRRMGHLYRMTLAAEPLVELLLARGDIEGARVALDDLRATNPSVVDADYRSSVLELRIALAKGDKVRIGIAYGRVRSLAGERHLPSGLIREPLTLRQTPSPRS